MLHRLVGLPLAGAQIAYENTQGFAGAWLSLVERFVRDEEVAGSNPVAPKSSPSSLLGPVFSRFSPASWHVVRSAEQESRNHNDYFIGAEHLLAALLEERDPAVIAALEQSGVDLHELHAEVRRTLGAGEERLWEGILVTPRVRKIVALAEQLAGGREIEPLDLLEAIQAEGGSRAAEILRRLGRNAATAAE